MRKQSPPSKRPTKAFALSIRRHRRGRLERGHLLIRRRGCRRGAWNRGRRRRCGAVAGDVGAGGFAGDGRGAAAGVAATWGAGAGGEEPRSRPGRGRWKRGRRRRGLGRGRQLRQRGKGGLDSALGRRLGLKGSWGSKREEAARLGMAGRPFSLLTAGRLARALTALCPRSRSSRSFQPSCHCGWSQRPASRRSRPAPACLRFHFCRRRGP